MDWIGPAVVAAVVSGVVSGVGFLVGRSTTLTTHQQKLAADRQLAERKVEADIALAKAKFSYDCEQSIFKRRFELAEQMLSDAYKLKSLMAYVRNGFAFGGEADSRKAHGHESESIKRSRDSYFVPQVRLQAENEFLGDMFARKTTCHAHFGDEANKAYDLFHQAIHQTRVASQLLVEWTGDNEEVDKETMKNLRCDIWQGFASHHKKDEIGSKIEEAVQICEKLCKPVLGSVRAV